VCRNRRIAKHALKSDLAQDQLVGEHLTGLHRAGEWERGADVSVSYRSKGGRRRASVCTPFRGDPR
jgi:hypothetical protein